MSMKKQNWGNTLKEQFLIIIIKNILFYHESDRMGKLSIWVGQRPGPTIALPHSEGHMIWWRALNLTWNNQHNISDRYFWYPQLCLELIGSFFGESFHISPTDSPSTSLGIQISLNCLSQKSLSICASVWPFFCHICSQQEHVHLFH